MTAWLHTCKPYCVSQEVKVRPDAAVWNALIAAAGRAGQLQRAFEALQDMQVQSRLYSDSHTLCHKLCCLWLILVHLACIMNKSCFVFECSSDTDIAASCVTVIH